MAYNSFYPNFYPNYAQQMQMQQIQQMQQMQPQMQAQTQPQIQNGGFVSVRSEEEARNYPVAPGTSVTDDKVTEYALKSDLNALQTQLQGLVAEIEELKKKQPMNNAKKKGDSEQ